MIYIILCIFFLLSFPQKISAIYNPLEYPNNKYGIHVADPNDISDTSDLVNSNGGDWGYVTLVIQENDRNIDKWQGIFDLMRRKHLIPIVRLATYPQNDAWAIPDESKFSEWVDFLGKLNWVTENRYIVIFNEPNHNGEWDNKLDPDGYAHTLVTLGRLLKRSSKDYFILPAGLDVSAASNGKDMDAKEFLVQMLQKEPSIPEIIDGWVSHSYPNPGFSGSPNASGRGSIRSYEWEIDLLRSYGITKTLPIFITETGWQHSEGKNINNNFYESKKVGNFLKNAVLNAWNDSRIIAITPFVFSYQDIPFDHFSWKQYKSNDFYAQYYSYLEIPKISGLPRQRELYHLNSPLFPEKLVAGSTYSLQTVIKNLGQNIIDSGYGIKLFENSKLFSLLSAPIPYIEPMHEDRILIHINTPKETGKYFIKTILVHDNFESVLEEQNISIIPPPSLKISVKIGWRRKHTLDDLTVLLYNMDNTLIHKFTNMHAENRQVVVNGLYDIIPGQKYRIVVVYPYHIPRQSIVYLYENINNVSMPRLLPIDFNNDGAFSIKDLYKMISMSPYQVVFRVISLL